MNYDWTTYRKQELQCWKAELVEAQKGVEAEMEKHQKIREKYRLRLQVALQTKPYLSPSAYEKAIAHHKKKQEQVSQDVHLKLQSLMQQLETINGFKRAISDAMETDPDVLLELEIKKKSLPEIGSSQKGPSKMKLSKRKFQKKGS